MRYSVCFTGIVFALICFGCQQQSGSESSSENPQSESTATEQKANDKTTPETTPSPTQEQGSGMMMRGGGPGAMRGMRGDMMTLHALFDGRDKIKRTIKNLPNGAETLTESDDAEIASLLQKHVPEMEGRVLSNDPLPPMRFHPLFQELIKKAEKVDFNYEETKHGIKVVYTSEDPYVVLLIQEHAKLVSRFIKNGMQEIHKPYKIPEMNDKEKSK